MIEDWEVEQLRRKFPDADITRDEGAWFTARHPGSEQVFRDRSAAVTESWLRRIRDERQVSAVFPRPGEARR
jgi:hypothetical protein